MNQNRIQNKFQSGFADNYLKKSGTGKRIIEAPPDKNLKYIVVMPAFNESGLIQSLDSLFKCESVDESIEVFTVINCPYNCSEETLQFNIKLRDEAEKWSESHNIAAISFHFIFVKGEDKKNSGVGFARKTGMDEAITRFNLLDRPEGIILSLDADALVDRNYFRMIDEHFRLNPDTDGCSIYYEHPLEGKMESDVYKAIAQYELHLRYYVESMRYSGHPNVFHTVGSAFAVKAATYCKQGGMNKRQGGEDFYFLQKIFDLGNFSECNSTRVIPSPRPSDRVPFGTGPVVLNFLKDKKEIKTNNPELFEILKDFLLSVPLLYECSRKRDFNFINNYHPVLREFLIRNNYEERIIEIHENSSDPDAFRKRFLRWFNMFRCLKFLNHARSIFPDIPVTLAALALLKKKGIRAQEREEAKYYLNILRNLEKNTSTPPSQQ